MSIYISNSLYIDGSLGADFNDNNPIIGYHSVLKPADFNITGATSTRPAINLWSPDTSSAWEGESYSGVESTLIQYVNIDNPDSNLVDYIGIAKHNLGTGGYTVTVEVSEDLGTNWLTLKNPTLFNDDRAILIYFDLRTSRSFRIKIEKTSTDIIAPIISHIKLGKALVLQRRINAGHTPAALASMVKKTTFGSENGQYLGQVISRSYHKTSCSQENTNASFVRENIVPFIKHINGEVEIEDTAPATFFFAWRPTKYPDEVVYGWTNDQIQPSNTQADFMSFDFSIEAVA